MKFLILLTFLSLSYLFGYLSKKQFKKITARLYSKILQILLSSLFLLSILLFLFFAFLYTHILFLSVIQTSSSQLESIILLIRNFENNILITAIKLELISRMHSNPSFEIRKSNWTCNISTLHEEEKKLCLKITFLFPRLSNSDQDVDLI